MVASSVIASEIAARANPVNCSGVHISASAGGVLKHTLAHETCVAAVKQ